MPVKPSAPREDKPLLGIALGLGAFLCFALTDTVAKLTVGAGISVLIVVFFRYAVNFVLVAGYFLPRDGLECLRSNVPHLQIARGITLLSSTSFNFWALKYLPLTITIPIFFAIPLLVCVLSVPMLGEKVGLRRYIAVLIGFIGVLVILRPGSVAFHPAMLISLTASFTGALYFIFTRMVAGRDNMPVGQIYASGIATTCLLPFAILYWETPTETHNWIFLIAAGAFAGLGHCLITTGNRFLEAAKMAPLVYSEIIYITMISWILFKELPDFWTLVGTLIIIGSGTYVWWRERSQSASNSL